MLEMLAELHAHAFFLSRFHGLVRQRGAEQIFFETGRNHCRGLAFCAVGRASRPSELVRPRLEPRFGGVFLWDSR